MPNLGSSYYVASAASDLICFLEQSGFVVTVPAEEDETVPTIEEGELVGTIARNADGEYVVSPVASGAFVSVNCVGTNTIVVPPSVIGFMGVPLAQLKVKAGSLDLTGAFLPQDVGDGAYYLMLDETASVQVGEELITVQPQLTGATEPIKPFVIGATASVGVKTIPGLKYTLWRGTDLDGLMSEVQAQTTDWIVEKVADSTRTKLTDTNPPAGQAFYVIQVQQPFSAGQP